MNDVRIEKLSGGLGRRNPSGDMISGLLANGVAVTGGVQLNTIYRLAGTKDANDLGLTEAYDTANTVLVYEHIASFFRENPSGDLRIMLVAQTVSFADLADKTKENAKKLLREENGEIKQLAIAYNPTAPVADFTATLAAVAKAQELYNEEYVQHRPVEFILEGKGFDSANTTVFRGLNAENVTVFCGQSLSVANREIASAKPFLKYADVGSLLGSVSKAKVNESIAWVGKFNAQGGNLQVPAIGGVAYSTISEGVLNTLNDNGAVFFKTHIGRAGIYYNDSHTCTALTNDYAYIEMNRTSNKAVRAIRQVLLPRLASPLLIDQNTGYLSSSVSKSFEMDGKRSLEVMERNEEISGLDVLVDPNQNLLSGDDLVVDFELVPTGTARNIRGKLGLKNPLISN